MFPAQDEVSELADQEMVTFPVPAPPSHPGAAAKPGGMDGAVVSMAKLEEYPEKADFEVSEETLTPPFHLYKPSLKEVLQLLLAPCEEMDESSHWSAILPPLLVSTLKLASRGYLQEDPWSVTVRVGAVVREQAGGLLIVGAAGIWQGGTHQTLSLSQPKTFPPPSQ